MGQQSGESGNPVVVVALLVAGLMGGACGKPASDHSIGEGRVEGVAMADCAPWDGPASSIFIPGPGAEAPTSPPYLHIIVYVAGASLPGTEVLLGLGQAGSGAAVRCRTDRACTPAASGVVRFESGADSLLSGTYRVEFPDDTVRGEFHAAWTRRTAMCG